MRLYNSHDGLAEQMYLQPVQLLLHSSTPLALGLSISPKCRLLCKPLLLLVPKFP